MNAAVLNQEQNKTNGNGFPSVSLVIPAFNEEKYIGSLLDQIVSAGPVWDLAEPSPARSKVRDQLPKAAWFSQLPRRLAEAGLDGYAPRLHETGNGN